LKLDRRGSKIVDPKSFWDKQLGLLWNQEKLLVLQRGVIFLSFWTVKCKRMCPAKMQRNMNENMYYIHNRRHYVLGYTVNRNCYKIYPVLHQIAYCTVSKSVTLCLGVF
jgi:hypothetical protein